jgi:hypothetical protein
MEVGGQLHTLAPSLLENETLIRIGYEGVWAQELMWRWQGERIPAPSGNQTLEPELFEVTYFFQKKLTEI